MLGPGLANVDFSVTKDFSVFRESKIQFRVETFNLFNHTNLNAPRAETLTSGTYGRVTSALDPRIFQFGLKWQF